MATARAHNSQEEVDSTYFIRRVKYSSRLRDCDAQELHRYAVPQSARTQSRHPGQLHTPPPSSTKK